MQEPLIQWVKYIIDLFNKGGLVMYPLMLCSLTTVALIIEKYVNLRQKKAFPPDILSVLPAVRGIEDVPVVRDAVKANPCCLGNIILVALDEYEAPPDVTKEYLEEQGRQEVARLERGMTLLETMATVSPLLGLLGTVTGLMKMYTEMVSGGVGDPGRLAAGIYEALITTVFGLVIGIPALIFYTYFDGRVSAIVLQMERYTSVLLRRLRKSVGYATTK